MFARTYWVLRIKIMFRVEKKIQLFRTLRIIRSAFLLKIIIRLTLIQRESHHSIVLQLIQDVSEIVIVWVAVWTGGRILDGLVVDAVPNYDVMTAGRGGSADGEDQSTHESEPQ